MRCGTVHDATKGWDGMGWDGSREGGGRGRAAAVEKKGTFVEGKGWGSGMGIDR